MDKGKVLATYNSTGSGDIAGSFTNGQRKVTDGTHLYILFILKSLWNLENLKKYMYLLRFYQSTA